MPSSWPRGRLRHFSALRPSSDGSHLSLIHIRRSRRNAVALMGISLADALIMASRTPAAFLGLETELGRIAPVSYTHKTQPTKCSRANGNLPGRCPHHGLADACGISRP